MSSSLSAIRANNLSYMKSVSEADDSLGRSIIRPPYIQVTIAAINNLDELQQGNIEPYIVLSLGESYFETKVLVPNEEVTDNTYEFDVLHLKPLVLSIMDKDDYGKHSLVSSISIPEACFSKWAGHTEDIYIRIEPIDDSGSESESQNLRDVSEDQLLTTDAELGAIAHLHLKLAFMDETTLNKLRVEFKEHHIRSTANETYTQYSVEVIRGDGIKWTALMRYSQVSALRSNLTDLLPGFRELDFPGKTYMECLSGICSGLSRFDEERIERRKQGMESFINMVLQKPKYVSDPLMELLQVSGHARANQEY